MSNQRQVFFNSDARGITLLSVALYSLLRSSDPSRPLVIYIAYGLGFREAHCDRKLSEIAARYPFARLKFLDFDPLAARYAELFASAHNRWSTLLWAFPLCTELLPEDVHGNIVYLDIDMLIRKDLDELYQIPLREEGFLAAAVDESPRETRPHMIAAGWPEEAGCGFSNATLVINVDAYRHENIPEKIIAWYAAHKDGSIAVDQDAQNIVFGARTKRLPVRWNYSDGWLPRAIKFPPWRKVWRVHARNDMLEAILDPCIIHYVGRRKPTGFTHRPERKIYHQALRELGLYDDCFPHPPNLRQKASDAFFDCYHALLRVYVRMLRRLYLRQSTGEVRPRA